VPTTTADRTLADIHHDIEKNIRKLETINYVYVLDEAGKLIGILSLKDVVGDSSRTKKAWQLCKKEQLVTVKPWTDQERVAYLALKHNIKAVPVVDADHTFLGVIPSDAILHILYKETHEDLMRRAGIHSGHAPFDDVLSMPIGRSLLHRLPWLLIGLLGGVLTARVIGLFEETLEQNLILAAFIPLIVYMSDAVGTQMEAFIIRDIAVDHRLPFLRYFGKQLFIVFLIAVLFGVLIFLAGSLLSDNPAISMVLAVSLFGAVCSSVFTGLLIPYGFHKLRMDPANASGPVATIIQDLLSIVIYFGIAAALL